MPLSIDELVRRQNELADRFEAYDPQPGDEGEPSLVVELYLAARARAEAEKRLADKVGAARQQALSWRAIGEAIGTSGEAARQRYGKESLPAQRNGKEGGSRIDTNAPTKSAGRIAARTKSPSPGDKASRRQPRG